MKKLLILGIAVGIAVSFKAQTTFTGAPTNTYGAAYRSGNVGIGFSNNLNYPVTLPDKNKLTVYTTDGSGLGVIETGGGNASLTLRTSPDVNTDFAWLLNTSSGGEFSIQKEYYGVPSFLINANNRISIGGNTSPNCSVHVGDGAGSLHYGTTGILMKFAGGDRTLMEIHDPTGQSKLAIQSLSWGSYVSSLNTNPLFMQTSGGNLIVGADALLSGAKMQIIAPSAVDNALDITNSTTGSQVFRVKTNGSVYANEVWVQASPFPDYVFSDKYKLLSIDNLKLYIATNKHLPNVPTAKEVTEKGMNVGELNRVQMEKIEELTLYIIQLKEEIEVLKKEMLKNR